MGCDSLNWWPQPRASEFPTADFSDLAKAAVTSALPPRTGVHTDPGILEHSWGLPAPDVSPVVIKASASMGLGAAEIRTEGHQAGLLRSARAIWTSRKETSIQCH